MNKKNSQRVHARRRAKLRYGIKLSRQRVQEIIKKIQRGRSKFVKRTSNTKSVFYVTCGDVKMKVVYDSKRKSIVTVLPLKY
ncbi:hypothetical protein LCGC14_1739070 [marine sediment metagenome]|uniref:DUF4258 domain-containing protein n=1 Tax=marine sediment metagenome TaxID=412755 RepID=A0A0F9HUX6_9ZZZZ